MSAPRELAAITFTEAAAAELRDRVREQLEQEAERLDLLDAGNAYSFAFEDAGSYRYVCGIHPTMTGTVVVEE